MELNPPNSWLGDYFASLSSVHLSREPIVSNNLDEGLNTFNYGCYKQDRGASFDNPG